MQPMTTAQAEQIMHREYERDAEGAPARLKERLANDPAFRLAVMQRAAAALMMHGSVDGMTEQ